jgi:hypothetical protein
MKGVADNVREVCATIRELSTKIEKQVDALTRTHEDFVINRVENIKDHEAFTRRILKIEDTFTPSLKELHDEDGNIVEEKHENYFVDAFKKATKSWVGKLIFGLLLWSMVWGIQKCAIYGEPPFPSQAKQTQTQTQTQPSTGFHIHSDGSVHSDSQDNTKERQITP